ncbi:MAG: hypothetical protein M1817_005536 [Caeruleum heppii]|nr:MAG: hypothetical protein M1817_005536 [Caeruleum heppii]
MNAAVAMNEAYLEVWGERPFSNVPIICAWKKEDVRRWLFNKIPCTIKKQPEEEIALPLDLVEMLPGSDCVVFAIHVLDRRPSAGSFVHNGSHGAHMGLIDERFVIVDSTARQAFALREGEKFGEENNREDL